jgi:hypothetical protein
MKTKLLTVDGNPKTAKGNAAGYVTGILHLAPWKAAGINVCPMAELAGCITGCLNTAGRGGLAADNRKFAPHGVILPDNSVQAARVRKTRFYADDRVGFMDALASDIRALIRLAIKRNAIPAVRLNGTSDIAWENIPVGGKSNIFELFPDVQFYDYTKLPSRNVDAIPNYHLTASYSEASPAFASMVTTKGSHLSWAVVFDVAKGKPMPSEYMGRPVIDGDETDLRFLDPPQCIVGLRAKGAAKRDQSGFVVRLTP